MFYKKWFKKVLDTVSALIGFAVFLPLFVAITVILFVDNKGTPFFLQKRPGRDEKYFYVIKFKTMSDEKDENGIMLPDAKRLTKVGHLIRKTSLDELPQLINVIKGDMSLVGPRPLSVKYLPLYSADQRRRHNVKPGITGWAQINGRNTLAWSKRFEYDLYYVDNISFWFDMRILFHTALKVIRRADVSAGGNSEVESFNGRN